MKSTLDFHPKFLASLASYSKEKFTKDLMAGIIKIHIYMTPPSPAQEIDFILEYDTSYVTSALQA